MTTGHPHIAILGAGPTGLEAALAAGEAGYPFTLYEAGDSVAGHIRDWGHVRLFSPWSFDLSPRMRRHLEAAGHELPPADSDECPTGDELVSRVLEPLATLPELAPHLETGVRVREVGREGLLKHEEIASAARAERRFRLLLEDAAGREWVEHADVVLDCTGTWSHPNRIGDGGIAAPGERAADAAIVRRIPDVFREPEAWGGKKILLIGSGHSAQTAVVDLAELASSRPGTRIVWALRREHPEWIVDPDDPLPERAALTLRAQRLADGGSPAVEAMAGVVVESLTPSNGGYQITLRRDDGSETVVVVDKILALTGFVGDHALYRQLQVHECYATASPMKLAAALLGSDSGDCVTQESHGAETLVNPEPGFFILGSKSYGRTTTFLMRVGWQQVDEVFELLGGSG